MKIDSIIYAPYFKRAYKKLPPELKAIFPEKEKLFRQNCFYPLLKTHKLGGKCQGYWAFSLDYHNRAMFQFADNGRVYFFNVGYHSIYE